MSCLTCRSYPLTRRKASASGKNGGSAKANPVEAFPALGSPCVRQIILRDVRWLNDSGVKADIPALRSRYAKNHLHAPEKWLRKECWHKCSKHVRPEGIDCQKPGRIGGSSDEGLQQPSLCVVTEQFSVFARL